MRGIEEACSVTSTHAPRGYAALIVEDEAILAKNVVTFLQRRGITAHAVESGRAALDWIAERQPDVVLIDYDLPGMDGLTLIGHVRALCPEVPIVMVTGRGDASLEARARRQGANDYRTKPIGLAEVKRTLDALVRLA